MKNKLKSVRVLFSLLFIIIVLFFFLFAEQNYLPLNMFKNIQFVPALFNGSILFFIILLLSTLIFGRLYCSFLCPLGIFQDIIIFIRQKTNPKKFFRFTRSPKIIPSFILLVVVISLLSGNFLVFGTIDPFSISGRIVTYIIKPIYIILKNTVSIVLSDFNIFFVSPEKSLTVTKIIFTTFIYFLFVFIITIFKGRHYCNLICPVGILTGLISRFSIFKIRIDNSSCTGCSVCENKCKALCINAQEKYIDFSRCILCFNCLNSCVHGSITYRAKIKDIISSGINDSSRRDLLKDGFNSAAALLLFIIIPVRLKLLKTNNQTKNDIILPPGAGNLASFALSCTACGLCVSCCPTKVITISPVKNYPALAHLNFPVSFCEFNCNRCTSVCPTNAIKYLKIKDKKITQLGTVSLLKKKCIVFANEKNCGACAEHCPTRAVSTYEYKKNLYAPKIDNNFCIGCGACEYICPTVPDKAIFVESAAYQKKIKRLKQKELPAPSPGEEDFPF